MNEFKNLKANSNLGFATDMTVDVITHADNTIYFKFSTGFEATATFKEHKEDWEGNLISIYEYEVSNGETHHLHMRTLKSGGIYFQTIQTPENPGGSTFNTLDEKLPEDFENIRSCIPSAMSKEEKLRFLLKEFLEKRELEEHVLARNLNKNKNITAKKAVPKNFYLDEDKFVADFFKTCKSLLVDFL